MELSNTELKTCPHCELEIVATSNFCKYCGQPQNYQEQLASSNKKKSLKQGALFIGFVLAFCLLSQIIQQPSLGLSIFLDVTFAILTLLFFTASWKENKHLLRWPNFSIKKLLLVVVLTPIASLIVQILVTLLNEYILEAHYSYESLYSAHPYGNYIMVVSIAVFPAIFEELGFRGYLMQKLLGILDQKEAIYITSFLFFLMHLSLLSFFWMLPLALVLAKMRLKENTLWYGIVMHFLFNFTSCLFTIYFVS